MKTILRHQPTVRCKNRMKILLYSTWKNVNNPVISNVFILSIPLRGIFEINLWPSVTFAKPIHQIFNQKMSCRYHLSYTISTIQTNPEIAGNSNNMPKWKCMLRIQVRMIYLIIYEINWVSKFTWKYSKVCGSGRHFWCCC